MARSRIFGFLAIALCLVACLCVSAEVSKDDAAQEIADVQEKASKALNDANENVKKANDILGRVQSHKKGAEKAAADAANAAKGNKKAEAVADKVQEEAKKAIALYAEANAAAQAAVESAKEKVPKAEKLKKDANIAVSPDTDGGSDYKNAKEAATKVKGDVEALQREITESGQLLGPASTAESNMAKSVEKVQISKHHVFAVNSRTRIEKQLEKADAAIRTTEKQRDEVNETLKEMKKVAKNAPEGLSAYVNKAIKNVGEGLSTTTKAVADAKKAREEIVGIKKNADASVEKIRDATVSKEAASEERNVKQYAEDVMKKVPKISGALQLAKKAAENVKFTKDGFMKTLLKDDGKEDGVVEKLKKLAGKIMKDGTNGPLNNGRVSTFVGNIDSPIFASFSLLLALIVCAALH